MFRKADITGSAECDRLNSRELYDILNIEEFTLPPYPDFAVDYCRRLNMGQADYYGIRDKCAAVSLSSGRYALIAGIVSRQKGLGGKALNAIIQKNHGKTVVLNTSINSELKHFVVVFNDKSFVDFWVDFVAFWKTSQ